MRVILFFIFIDKHPKIMKISTKLMIIYLFIFFIHNEDMEKRSPQEGNFFLDLYDI